MISQSENSEAENKVQELQILEQGLQNLVMQKQAIQLELNEIANALEELKKTNEEAYKVLGGVMFKADKPSLIKELSEKKALFDLRISAIEKQEKIIKEKAEKLQKELMQTLNKKKN
ncbi:MAG: prefoldin subunit beta [Candidatus Pacearchaeota archaeon]